MTPIIEPRPQCALVWNDESISYSELLRHIRSFEQFAPEPGSRAVLFSENRPEWVYAAYAVWAARAVLVPVDHLSTAEELAYVVGDCDPAVVFCSRETADVVRRALELTGKQPRVVSLDESEGDTALTSAPSEALTVDEHALGAIVYTSGTTGSPKGVMLSFGNLLANVRPVVEAGYFDAQARVLLLLPLHHVLPLAGSLVAPLFGGSTIVFATSMAGEKLLKLLRQHRITVIVGVPRFYDLLHRALRERIEASAVGRRLYLLAKRLRSRRFSKLVFGSVHRKFGGALTYLVCGGAALSPDTAETFHVLGFHVCEGYGMTECAPMISFPRPSQIKLGSCGQALDGCEIRIDDNGEILARGPNVMLGYYGRPRETQEVLRDGWLHTGDTGTLDEAGYLYVTGRLKDIIVFPSGKKLDPSSVEVRLSELPSVREAGVFLDGDTLHVVMLPNFEQIPATAHARVEEWLRREVVDRYNASVSPYRRVARITIATSELPRTRLGKLKRHLLSGIAEGLAHSSAEGTENAAPTDTTEASLLGYFARQSGKVVGPTSRLVEDLGLDSLGLVELAAFVARNHGVDVTEARLAQFETVADLSRYVASYRKEGTADASDVSWSELLLPSNPPPLPRSGFTHLAIVHASRLAVRWLFRIEARGQEQLPKRPFILLPNHQSYLDGLFVAAFLAPGVALRTMFYAKVRHVRSPFLRWLARRCNTIVMDPEMGFLFSLQQVAAGLRRGDNVMIFPEGTRSPDGELGEFKDSYAIVARELDVPVVPVVITGAFAVLPRGRRMPRFTQPIKVTYLAPQRIGVAESTAEFNHLVHSRMRAAMLHGSS